MTKRETLGVFLCLLLRFRQYQLNPDSGDLGITAEPGAAGFPAGFGNADKAVSEISFPEGLHAFQGIGELHKDAHTGFLRCGQNFRSEDAVFQSEVPEMGKLLLKERKSQPEKVRELLRLEIGGGSGQSKQGNPGAGVR